MPAVYSFSARKGLKPPSDVIVFDCRLLNNPHHDKRLRALTGLHEAVQKEVLSAPDAARMVMDAVRCIEAGLSVAFKCTAGRHRSVAIAEEVAKRTDSVVRHLNAVNWVNRQEVLG